MPRSAKMSAESSFQLDKRSWTDTSGSSSSLLSDSTGYGSYHHQQYRCGTPDCEFCGDNDSVAYYSGGSLNSEKSSRKLKSAISEASIDSFFKPGAEFYDLNNVDFGNESPGEYSVESDPDALDEVRPSAELARQDVSEMARCILGLIENIKIDNASPSTLKSIPEEHIYEEIPYDSPQVDLNAIKPPPLPKRNFTQSSVSLNEYPNELRKKKIPSLYKLRSISSTNVLSHGLVELSNGLSDNCTCCRRRYDSVSSAI